MPSKNKDKGEFSENEDMSEPEFEIGERDFNTHLKNVLFYIKKHIISITQYALLAWLYYSMYTTPSTRENTPLSEPCPQNTISNEVEKLQKEISESRSSFDEKFQEFNERLTKLGKEHREVYDKLGNQMEVNLKSCREYCSNMTATYGLDMNRIKNENAVCLKMSHNITQLEWNIAGLQSKLLNHESKIEEKIQLFNEHKNEFDQMKKEFIDTIETQKHANERNDFQSQVDKLHAKVDTCTKDLDMLTKFRNEEEKDINQIRNEQKQLAENSTELYMTYNTGAAVFVAYGLVIVLIVITIQSKKYGLPSNSQTEVVRPPLDEIGRRNDLENSLCIVNFSSKTQAKHSDMISSLNDTDTERRSYTVNKHGDLTGIPPSKLFVVFVDYNDRNIILESENESGNLLKTTVKAIWKMGGDVILVYCGDELSKVAGEELYSAKLSSINEQQELKQLESKQRVLSVYQNTFSDHQKRHLRNIMIDLKRRE